MIKGCCTATSSRRTSSLAPTARPWCSTGGRPGRLSNPFGRRPRRTGISENGRAADEVEPAWFSPAATFQLTPDYASPEQLAGRINEMGRTSDIYSLARSSAACSPVILHAGPDQNGPVPGLDGRPRLPRPLRHATEGAGGPEGDLRKALSSTGRRTAMPRRVSGGRRRPLARGRARLGSSRGLDRPPLPLSRRHRAWTRAGAVALVLVTCVSVAGALLVNRARREAVAMSARDGPRPRDGPLRARGDRAGRPLAGAGPGDLAGGRR